jgi:hypothetical protein
MQIHDIKGDAMVRIGHDHDSPSEVSERRRSSRFRACFPATVDSLFTDRQLCVCRDLSASGGLFLTSAKLVPGDELLLEMFIDAPGGEPHKTAARVVRVGRHQPPDTPWRYDTAVEFTSATSDFTPAAKALAERQASMGLFRSETPPATSGKLRL